VFVYIQAKRKEKQITSSTLTIITRDKQTEEIQLLLETLENTTDGGIRARAKEKLVEKKRKHHSIY